MADQGLWPQCCLELVELLGFQDDGHGELRRLKDLYGRCVAKDLRNHERATDLLAFNNLVREALGHIQTGWPSITKVEVRNALADASPQEPERGNNTVGSIPSSLIDKAINTALCVWLSIDCANSNNLGAMIWPATQTLEQFVLGWRFEVAVGADPLDRRRYFPAGFRAARLQVISGIGFEQTYYLDQHLRFNQERRIVKVFVDISWLQVMIRLFRKVIDASDEQVAGEEIAHEHLSDEQTQAATQSLEPATNDTIRPCPNCHTNSITPIAGGSAVARAQTGKKYGSFTTAHSDRITLTDHIPEKPLQICFRYVKKHYAPSTSSSPASTPKPSLL